MTAPVVSSNAKLIYARLCRYAGEKGVAYPRLDQLAGEVGMATSTMRRALDELVEHGMLETVRRGLGLPNDYFFLWHPLMDNPDCPSMSIPDCPPVSTLECPPVSTPISRESIKRVRQENTPVVPTTLFEDFWLAYPLKVGKPKALASWRTQKLDGCCEVVIGGLERWKLSPQWRRDSGKFIPHPTTFLNQRRWEDSPEPDVPRTIINEADCPF